MPKKSAHKNKKQCLSQSQKKYITKRLMEMSLKVDKYIYKQKPLFIAQVQTYLEEVVTYKELYFGDERSLQVIEKLTRCLKAIMVELKSNAPCATDSESVLENIQNSANYAPSPVYSLTDEDMTQMIEYSNNVNDVVESVSPITSKEVSTKSTIQCSSITFQKDKNETQTELTCTVLIPNVKQINKEQIIDKELSDIIIDLTLNNYENETFEDTCSQSILNNINDVNINQNTISENVFQKEQRVNFLARNETNNNFVSHACGQAITEIDKIIEVKEISIPHRDKQDLVPCKSSMHTNNLKGTEKVVLETKPNENFKIQKVFAEMSQNDINEDKPKTKPSKKANRVVKKQTKENKNDCKLKNTKRANYKTKSINNNIKCDTTAKQTDPVYPVTNYSDEACGLKITTLDVSNSRTTKYIEEDLSWIENIKYIREIHVEEYEHNVLSTLDCFWDNCDLPENWNERDFDF